MTRIRALIRPPPRDISDRCRALAALAKIPVIVSTWNPAAAPQGAVVVPKPLKLDRLIELISTL